MYHLEVHTSRGQFVAGPYSTIDKAQKAAEQAAIRGWLWAKDGTTLIMTSNAHKINII